MMKIAFAFPGQGAQSVGMLDPWSAHPQVQRLIARADLALQAAADSDEPLLSKVISSGPSETLGLTVNTQPAMLLAALAALEAWKTLCLSSARVDLTQAAVVAGHSLGEYSALVAAGSFTLEQALPLVRLRAQAMQEAVPVGCGSMAAILGLSDEAVLKVCLESAQGDVVEAVNFNAPAQVVIAGHVTAVGRACEAAKAAGAKRALALAVSAPFHSSLLKPAGDRLRMALEPMEVQAPQIPLINNVDVKVEHQADAIKDALVRQAFSPVRWVEVVQAMKAQGITHLIEFGPGKVLCGLVGRIDKDLKTFAVFDPASAQSAFDGLSAA
jgi:[acyl-carrier-protein] S-malonyltransferase